MYDNCDGDRDVELVDPTPVLNLKRKEGKRPAILIGLRDNENDSGVIKVGQRSLLIRADRKSQVRQCLGFCTTDFWYSLAYESAEQKPKQCLT